MRQAEILNEQFLYKNDSQDWEMRKLLYLQPELFWFKGHFPSQAILPGIAQTKWVLDFAQPYLPKTKNRTPIFLGFSRIKFQKPLMPLECVQLNLEWVDASQQFKFNYAAVGQGRMIDCSLDHKGIPASNGVAKFAISDTITSKDC